MGESYPIDHPCSACGAQQYRACGKPRGHAPLGSNPYHASRRKAAGLEDGPLSPGLRCIRMGVYQHGCGEPIRLNECADAIASDGTRCSWNEAPCPRCAETVWIEDLGPLEAAAGFAGKLF